jgi:hypothetical protein
MYDNPLINHEYRFEILTGSALSAIDALPM